MERNETAGKRPGISSPPEKCPYSPIAIGVFENHSVAELPTAKAIFGELQGHPAITPQTESLRRIAKDRSRQKRGPPSLKLF